MSSFCLSRIVLVFTLSLVPSCLVYQSFALSMPSESSAPIDFPTQVQMDLGFCQSTTMGEHVLGENEAAPAFENKEELLRILTAIRLAAKIIAREMARSGLARGGGSPGGSLGAHTGSTNVQGELQTTLDVFSHKLFVECLRKRDILCGMVSEEEDHIIELSAKGKSPNYIVLIDPLDGSSNIDVDIPVGSIFSVVRRQSAPGTAPVMSDFLQKGTAIIAAGYIIYGPCMMLVYSTGQGVNGFTLDTSIGTLYLTHPNMRFPNVKPEKGIYSVNEGNFNSFPPGVQQYILKCRDRQQSARYVGSLVADFHRNLIKGGVYIYPATKKDVNGKLRLLYECNPIAFLAEAAGGKASTGSQRILDIAPNHIHQRVPLIVGPKCMVEEVEEMIRRSTMI